MYQSTYPYLHESFDPDSGLFPDNFLEFRNKEERKVSMIFIPNGNFKKSNPGYIPPEYTDDIIIEICKHAEVSTDPYQIRFDIDVYNLNKREVFRLHSEIKQTFPFSIQTREFDEDSKAYRNYIKRLLIDHENASWQKIPNDEFPFDVSQEDAEQLSTVLRELSELSSSFYQTEQLKYMELKSKLEEKRDKTIYPSLLGVLESSVK